MLFPVRHWLTMLPSDCQELSHECYLLSVFVVLVLFTVSICHMGVIDCQVLPFWVTLPIIVHCKCVLYVVNYWPA